MKKNIIILILIFVGFVAKSQITSIQDSISLKMFFFKSAADTNTTYKDTAFKASVLTQVKVRAKLLDTLNIESVLIEFGRSDTSLTLLSKEFNYTNQGIFTDGTSYQRVKNNLTFSLGIYPALRLYQVKARIKYINGQYSSEYIFNNN